MKILMTGASGLVGSALIDQFKKTEQTICKLIRNDKPEEKNAIFWDPDRGILDEKKLEGFDVLIHLAGENIASGRWTEDKKRKILDSRVVGTRLLASKLALLQSPPRVFISASAIGYYGNRGEKILTEESGSGEGFLSEVCTKWEEAARIPETEGIRTVQARFGIVLSPSGGALKKMLPPFKWGLGGRIGSGKQYMSWVAIEDAAGAIERIINDESIHGPVNIVSPSPATNAEFTKALGSVLSRPAIFPLPAFAARLILGEMADEMLLCSARAMPKKLQQAGYAFLYPDLENALKHYFPT